MHRLIFGHHFAELVALILLPGFAFYFLNKKKASVRRNAEDADTGASGSSTVLTGTDSGGSSLSPSETNNGVSSLATAPTRNSYEVFLSFRGPDTRNNFTDHLYSGLLDAGVHAFRDNEELRQGEEIGPDLLAAIKSSKILIPILSENYCSSDWCLNELVQIMECKDSSTGTIVLPIFYKVAPADVRHQIGSFGKAFHERESRLRKRGFDLTILEKWKKALEEVSNLKGREANGSEAVLVKLIVQQVLLELKKKFELIIPENLVGIDSHVNKVMKLVDNNSCAIFIGIHGMGGIGKTTLAKSIYNKLINQFEHRSFIADIRESWKRNGAHYLQNQLIYDILKRGNQVHNKDEGIRFISSNIKGKKVLILLDDVDDDDQLKALVGNHNWFSSESMIIITTRNKSILDNARVDYQYEHEEMDGDNSLILFSRHAFRRDSPPSEFKDLAHDVVSTTGGLPLSLEVLGSFLCGKESKLWRGTIKKLRKVPHEKVQEKLRISYEALTYEQKQIFLDIACFFIGTDERIASYMWDACNFFPEEGVEVLRFLSLIKFGDDHKLRMHDQLRDLGREIVREENKMEPGNRSRLWDSKEVLEVLKGNEGTEKIKAINLSKDSSIRFGKTIDQGDNILTGKQFKKLRNLRFLDASGAHFSGDFKNSIKKLKWLVWEDCPSTFEANNFHVEELRVLELRASEISYQWRGWSSIMMAEKLQYLDLKNCISLERTFFLSAFKNLEVLILAFCVRIEQIDSSIGNMKSLQHLDLTRCMSLKGLPAEVGKLEALEQLILRHCEHLSSLPDSIGALQKLKILDIGWTEIEELPKSIGALQNLESLNISCTKIEELPAGIAALENLEILDISGTKIEELPASIGALQNLEILNISGTWIKELPNGIGRLRKLRDLNASNCHQLGGDMPESMGNLSSLQCLSLFACHELQSLPVLPTSLIYLRVTCQSRRLPSTLNTPLSTPFQLEMLLINGCKFMETLDVSQFSYLRTLFAGDCDNILEIRGLDKLQCLQNLEIADCASIERLNLPKSKGLKLLNAFRCKNLVKIQGLDKLMYLERFEMAVCNSIERLDLPKSKVMKVLIARYCENLVEIRGLDRLISLEEVDISGCTSIAKLDLPKSELLKIFKAQNCKNLVEIHGLDGLVSLAKIDISGCASIVKLDLPKFEGLMIFKSKNCENLVEIRGLDKLESLEEIDISGCVSIQRLDLPKSKGLKKLSMGSCKNLFEIQGLDSLEFLKVLNMSGCTSFGRLPNACCFGTLKKLAINCCDNPLDIQGLEGFPSCRILWIEGCNSLANFPKLSNFCNLKKLFLSNCHELMEIPGLEEATSLVHIAISGCSSINILPDFSSCTNLTSLVVQNCEKLTELQGLENLVHLRTLDISGCKSLKTTPELSRILLHQNYEQKPFDSFDGMTEFEEDDSDESEC